MSKTNTTIYIISILAIIFLTSNSLTAQTRSAGNTNNADIPQNEETEKTIFNTPLNRGYKLLHPSTKIGAYFGIGGFGVSFGHYIGDLVNTGNWIHGINLNISKHASYLYYSPTYYEDDSKSGFFIAPSLDLVYYFGDPDKGELSSTHINHYLESQVYKPDNSCLGAGVSLAIGSRDDDVEFKIGGSVAVVERNFYNSSQHRGNLFVTISYYVF